MTSSDALMSYLKSCANIDASHVLFVMRQQFRCITTLGRFSCGLLLAVAVVLVSLKRLCVVVVFKRFIVKVNFSVFQF